MFGEKSKFFLLVFILFAAFIFLYLSDFFRFRATQDYTLYVNNGANLSSTARVLHSNKIITANLTAMKIYYTGWKILHGCEKIYIGEYHVGRNEGYGSIVNKLCNGLSVLKTITIPEGFETREVIDAINSSENLIGNKVVSFDEGMFLPETYSFNSGSERSMVFAKMKKDMQNFMKQEWKKRDPEIDNYVKNEHEALILASIVEKEAKTDEERPVVAGVYLHRLQKRMRLEADPTAIYEITRGKYKLQRPLTRNDTKIKGEYNTYRKFGLPVTPICNPGKKSILAVLHPENTEYLYFVAKPDLQGHFFAKTYNEHLKNIKYVKKQAKESNLKK